MLNRIDRSRLAFVLFALVLTMLSCNLPLPAAQVPTGINVAAANSPTAYAVRTETLPSIITPSPTIAPTVTSTPVPRLFAKSVSAGFLSTCAVTLSGGVKCWGYNDSGRLGDGSCDQRLAPVDVVGLTGGIAAVSTGGTFTCALTLAGGVKCWGSNFYGDLGDNGASGRSSSVPVDVTGLSGGVVQVSVGMDFACALLQTGGVKCWGFNSADGTLGNPAYPISRTPVDVLGLSSVVSIAVGHNHSCALIKTGGVKCWGRNASGQLGNEKLKIHLPDYDTVDVKELSGRATAIAVGDEHSCALMEGGGIKCWGNNEAGELGDGTDLDRPTPADVEGLNGDAVAVAAASSTTCTLMKAGGIKCWGENLSPNLYSPEVLWFTSPTDVGGLENGVASLSIGLTHACVVMLDGGVKCWGNNDEGQIGDGTKTNRLTPVDVLCPDCGTRGPGATPESTGTLD